jgi:hypothetical protein
VLGHLLGDVLTDLLQREIEWADLGGPAMMTRRPHCLSRGLRPQQFVWGRAWAGWLVLGRATTTAGEEGGFRRVRSGGA